MAIDHESGWFGVRLESAVPKPVVGIITGSSLRLRKRIGYRSSFQTSLVAEIHPEGAGAVAVGRYGMFPATKAFLVVWIGLVGLVAGAFFLAMAASFFQGSGPRQDDLGSGLLISSGMLLFGVVLVGLGRLLARDEAKFLTGFLVRLWEAETPPPLTKGMQR